MAAWSPEGLDPIGRCILSSLTMDHRLCLHSRGEGKNWRNVVEISQLLYEHMSENNFESADRYVNQTAFRTENVEIRRLKTRTYLLATVDMLWSHMMVSNKRPCCLLVTAQKSSHVVFWKVSSMTENAALASVFELNQCGPTCMCWHPLDASSGLLAIGISDGLIQILNVSLSCDGYVSVSSFGAAWSHTDKVPVARIGMMTCGKNDQAVLVAAKEAFFVAVALDIKNELIKATTHCLIGSHTLSVTSIESVNNQYFLVLSADGVCQQIYPNFDKSEELTIELSGVDIDIKPNMASHGLAVSPNGAFLVFVDSPAGPYDHLLLREPLNVHIATLALNLDAASGILLDKSDSRLTKLLDVLEYIRISLNGGVTLPGVLLEFCDVDLKQASPFMLKLVRYLLSMQAALTAGTESEDRFRFKIANIDGELMCRRFQLLVSDKALESRLASNSSFAVSFLLLATWWLQYNPECSDKSIAQSVFDIRGLHFPDDPRNATWDTCAVCHEEVMLQNLTTSSCSNGHRMARCCQTLLQTGQLEFSSQRKCSLCGALAISPDRRDTWRPLIDDVCTFCDGFLVCGM